MAGNESSCIHLINKKPKNSRLVNLIRYHCLLCFIPGITSCIFSDDSSSPAPTPDMTGSWHGTFTPTINTGNVLAFDISIDDQHKSDFTGAWKWTTDSAWPADALINGYTYPSNNGGTLADLSLDRGGDITCCTIILGCYTLPMESIEVFGYLVNGTIVDTNANHRVGCTSSEEGDAIVTR